MVSLVRIRSALLSGRIVAVSKFPVIAHSLSRFGCGACPYSKCTCDALMLSVGCSREIWNISSLQLWCCRCYLMGIMHGLDRENVVLVKNVGSGI
jgi:hypothetical protein